MLQKIKRPNEISSTTTEKEFSDTNKNKGSAAMMLLEEWGKSQGTPMNEDKSRTKQTTETLFNNGTFRELSHDIE
jgi:hypothetical protein